MKKYLYILIAVVGLSSCSEFQKALKTEDIATKFKMGTELFDTGKFAKANRLFIQIVPNYRGKPQAEKLMFMYANTYYQLEDYYLSDYDCKKLEKDGWKYELTFRYTDDEDLERQIYELADEMESVASLRNGFTECSFAEVGTDRSWL